MIGALIMAALSFGGEGWVLVCESQNPRGFMDIKLVVPAETPLSLILSDARGRVITSVDLGHVWKGTHHIYMNTGRLSPGVYVLAADGLEEYLRTRVVVAR